MASLFARLPGFVIAGGGRAAAGFERRARRPVGVRRAGEIRPVRLLPLARLVVLLGRRHVDGVVQPAVPRRRHARGLGDAAIDHPAPLEAEARIDLAAARAVVAVAEFVLADELAVEPSPQLRTEGLAVPPGEKAEPKRFHAFALEPRPVPVQKDRSLSGALTPVLLELHERQI